MTQPVQYGIFKKNLCEIFAETDLMKKVLTLAVAAIVAAGIGAERADANTPLPQPVLTSIGAFDLSALNGQTLDYSLEGEVALQSRTIGTVNPTFDMVNGSYNDVAPEVAFPSLGFMDGGVGSWSSSFDAAYDYAVAFANAIADPLSQVNSVPFFPITLGVQEVYDSVSYAFAYGTTEVNPSVRNVNAVIVAYDGVNAAITETLVAFDSPDVGDPSTSVMGGNSDLWWAVQPGIYNNNPVPEIDGPVLVQVGFAIMGLYVLMLGRRRREDEVDMSQAAA